MGLAQVSYLCGVGGRAIGTVEVTTTEAAVGMAGALWLAAAAVVGTTAATGGSGCSDNDGSGIKVGVGPTSRGRRKVAYLGPEAVPSACLYHA